LGFLHQKVELLRLAVLMFLHQDSSEEQEQQIHSHLESSMQLYKENTTMKMRMRSNVLGCLLTDYKLVFTTPTVRQHFRTVLQRTSSTEVITFKCNSSLNELLDCNLAAFEVGQIHHGDHAFMLKLN